jgi:hypothetical protein
VTVNYIPAGAGAYTVVMTARLGAFDGTVIGTASQPFTLAAVPQQITFNFGNIR